MARDTLLGFPAHTLPYRHGESSALSTDSKPRSERSGAFHDDSSLFQQGHINIRGLTDVHAVGLKFIHPRTGELVELSCGLPEEFEKQLKKYRNMA